MSDEQIMELFFARDVKALKLTSEQYGTSLERMASRFVSREDAEECVNDTLLAAWNAIPPDRPEYFFAWLMKVCRNFALGKIEWYQAKKRSADQVAFDEELAQCIPDQKASGELESRELGRILSAFLMEQSKEKRILFLRRYWYGDSIAEVAETMGMTASNVKTILFRMRASLKEYLEKEEIFL